ncbi:TPA: hypothetical protein OKD67_001924 [Escherichia coli]|uniref:YobH family protein n=1 Tax=Escherichia coli TaxID=562 RepID=UPI001BE18DD0|nr:YobH family protein [Escherichia coli]MDZ3934436.1 YobH family protein [Escherichia marmotae]MEC9869983.1 YobH family protein [Escherichia marmotae]UMS28049.1 hypothetical protein AOY81_19665 [Escherichia coli]HBD3487223.1 hypothetical protein [Escherichia coli]HBD3602518.1 hypothetical protein [Escherichia coli]
MKKFTIGLFAIFLLVLSAFTGYGVKYSSITDGNKIECKYLSASGKFSRNYWHSDNGIMGISNCPLVDR